MREPALLEATSASDQLHWACDQCIDDFSVMSIHAEESGEIKGLLAPVGVQRSRNAEWMSWLAALDGFRNWLIREAA